MVDRNFGRPNRDCSDIGRFLLNKSLHSYLEFVNKYNKLGINDTFSDTSEMISISVGESRNN